MRRKHSSKVQGARCKVQGATRAEMAEALGVAIALNAGAALTYSARVMEAVSMFEKN